MSETNPPRRIKIYAIDESLMFQAMALMHQAEFIRLPRLAKVPEGARVTGVNHDWSAQRFLFRVEHESFPIVEEGCIPPIEGGGILCDSYRIEKI